MLRFPRHGTLNFEAVITRYNTTAETYTFPVVKHIIIIIIIITLLNYILIITN
jgi:hypothetical protein